MYSFFSSNKINKLLIVLLLTIPLKYSFSKEFYVSDISQLQGVLNIAASNGEDDTIYLDTGVYDLVYTFEYKPVETEKHSITIKATNFALLRKTLDLSIFKFDFSNIELNDNDNVEISIENLYFIEDSKYVEEGSLKYPLISIQGSNININLKYNTFLGNFSSYDKSAIKMNVNKGRILLVDNYFSRLSSKNYSSVLAVEGNDDDLILERNTFYANKSNQGFINISLNDSKVTFINNKFTGNSPIDYYIDSSAGIYIKGINNSIDILHNNFYRNISNKYGANINVFVEKSIINIIDNTFINNYSRFSQGSSLYIEQTSSEVNIIRNGFYRNTSSGGNLFIKDNKGKVFLGNNIIYDNYSFDLFEREEKGSAIYLDLKESKLDLLNNTIYGNRSHGYGSGLYVFADEFSKIKILNNIFWDNIRLDKYNSFLDDDDIYIDSNSLEIYVDRNVYKKIASSNKDIVVIGKNFHEDPLLKNPYAWDFHLTDDSYCINNGILPNENYPLIFYKDIDDNPRIVGDSIDIGADEFVESFSYKNKQGTLLIRKVEILDNIHTSAITNSMKLFCIDSLPIRTVDFYSWDIDGDGIDDFVSETSQISIRASNIDVEQIKCTIHYQNGMSTDIKYFSDL